MINSTSANNSSSESTSVSSIADNIARVINAIVLSITVYILLSLIVYGTRRKRWRTPPGGSSLQSGITFTCCVIATSLTLPRLIVNELIHYMRLTNRTILDCQVAGNVSGAFYFIPQGGLYVYLCLLLYKIYVHPYVRDKVRKCWRIFIPAFSITSVITIIAAAILTLRSMPVSWVTNNGCQYAGSTSTNAANIVSAWWVIVQTIMVSLYINAAIRTHFVSKSNTDSENGDTQNDCGDYCRIIFPCGSKRTVFHSPVERTVKHGVYSVIIIVISDVTLTMTTVHILPRLGLATFPSPLMDVSVMINVFCAIGALGCARDALGWWFPKCRKTVSNRQKDSHADVQRTVSISEGKD